MKLRIMLDKITTRWHILIMTDESLRVKEVTVEKGTGSELLPSMDFFLNKKDISHQIIFKGSESGMRRWF